MYITLFNGPFNKIKENKMFENIDPTERVYVREANHVLITMAWVRWYRRKNILGLWTPGLWAIGGLLIASIVESTVVCIRALTHERSLTRRDGLEYRVIAGR